jgi:hypothetical protein
MKDIVYTLDRAAEVSLVTQVPLDELNALENRGEILFAPGAEIIEDADRIATPNQRFDNMRPDESGAAGNQSLHFKNSLRSSAILHYLEII